MQLGKPVIIGLLHNERVRVGNIQTGFNNGGAHQHIKTLFPEINNDLLKARLGHLPVRHSYARIGNQLLDVCSSTLN